MKPNPRNGVPLGLLGAVALAVLVEALIAGHDIALITGEDLNWRSSRQAAAKRAPGCDVLCFGSSMVQVGVIPRVIERRTGRPAYNLSVVGGQIPTSYYYLRRALAAGARPSAVVIDLPPNFLDTDLRKDLGGWSQALGAADCLDMAWSTGSPEFFARVMLERSLPSVAYRRQLAGFALAALRGKPTSNLVNNLFGLRNTNRNRGAYIRAKNPDYRGDVAASLRDALLVGRWSADPVKARYLHRFLGLAAAHDIRVYWVIPPFCPALQAGRVRSGLDAAYERFVRSFQTYPNLFVIDGRRSNYGASVFMDACHLDPEGAYALSDDVADVISRRGGERWVSLPDYRARPMAVPIESAWESGMAVLKLLPPDVIRR